MSWMLSHQMCCYQFYRNWNANWSLDMNRSVWVSFRSESFRFQTLSPRPLRTAAFVRSQGLKLEDSFRHFRFTTWRLNALTNIPILITYRGRLPSRSYVLRKEFHFSQTIQSTMASVHPALLWHCCTDSYQMRSKQHAFPIESSTLARRNYRNT